jgi:hypothetical protein
MTKRDTKYLSVILTILISGVLLSCVPKVVTPEINRASYIELKDTEPDCAREIVVLQESPDKPDELVLDALYCYRKVWKHWENEYRVLDAQLESMKTTRE